MNHVCGRCCDTGLTPYRAEHGARVGEGYVRWVVLKTVECGACRRLLDDELEDLQRLASGDYWPGRWDDQGQYCLECPDPETVSALVCEVLRGRRTAAPH